MLPAMPAQVTHDVKIRSTKKLARARVLGVPPEEFGIERGARSIPDSNYCFHDVVTKTQADLIDEGYDKEQINAISDYTGRTEVETLARDTVQEHYNTGAGQMNKSARRVKVTEHYLRIDYEGTGRPCLYQIVTGGDRGEILKKNGKPAVTKFDRMPFAGATPVPVTHRFFGRSIADQVMDIQRIKTAILRGVLDNSYMVTNPRIEVAESNAGPNTIDDLLVARPNGLVRTKQPGGLMPIQTPPIGQYLLPVLDYMDVIRETRTGVTRQGQGLNADALQNQTATAVQQVFSASQARMKLIARVMAEGVRDMFALLHATIRKHGQEAQTVRLRNQWIQVDPRNWKTRNDMTINVALGNGDKAAQIGQLTVIGNAQKEMLQAGKTNLVDDAKLFNTASELVKLTGHKNPDRFFNDPTATNPDGSPKYPPPPPQMDPKLQIAQMNAQVKQQETAQKGQLEQVKATTDAYHQKVKTEGEITLAQIKADLDAKLALLDAHIKAMGQQQDMRHAEQQHHMDIAQGAMSMVQAQQKHEHSLRAMKNKPNA